MTLALSAFLATLVYLASVALLALVWSRTRVELGPWTRTLLTFYVAPATALLVIGLSLSARE